MPDPIAPDEDPFVQSLRDADIRPLRAGRAWAAMRELGEVLREMEGRLRCTA